MRRIVSMTARRIGLDGNHLGFRVVEFESGVEANRESMPIESLLSSICGRRGNRGFKSHVEE
jgi:hypothetical protein